MPFYIERTEATLTAQMARNLDTIV
jgi:hypothetical protein